jgi:hypothetical protein
MILIASVSFYDISQNLTIHIPLTFVTKEWFGVGCFEEGLSCLFILITPWQKDHLCSVE